MSDVAIRPERTEDRSASLEVERLAFGSQVEADIVEAVRGLPGSFALVGDRGGDVVGHVQCSRAWVGETPVVALGPIGVRPDHQGEGIGSALVRAALEEAAHRAECAVILLGDPRFYGRLGFRPGSDMGLHNPFAGELVGEAEGGFVIDEGDFQIAALDERARSLRGEPRWHEAFAAAG